MFSRTETTFRTREVLKASSNFCATDKSGAEYVGMFLPDHSLLRLKFLAIVLMTIDHLDSFVFSSGLRLASSVGRLAMPLFVFVLAYNLCAFTRVGHKDCQTRELLGRRMMTRMLLWGSVATLPVVALRWMQTLQTHPVQSGNLSIWDALFPLNIFFSLAVCVRGWMLFQGFLHLQERYHLRPFPQDSMARVFLYAVMSFEAVLLLFAGFFIEYHWWVILVFGSACWLVSCDTFWALLAFAVSLLSLFPFAQSLWPLGVLGLLALAQWRWNSSAAEEDWTGIGGQFMHWFGALPRGAFYAYYPVHLLALTVPAWIISGRTLL